jgi:RNA polymerase sigma factor (sigma-70 family)
MTDDTQLLQEYADGSEPAFRELVARYVNWVYSAAIRHLEDAHRAEDIVQTVFTMLARKARALPKDVVLGGWLYRHTCFVAAQAVRTERRRQARERQAVEMNAANDHPEPDWEQLSPFLDEAMRHLGIRDRDAIVSRYFEGRDLRKVGASLGVSEEAARKRVTRALEKLRSFFARRGVTLSATTLATLLAGHAVIAAPAGLAVTASGVALAAATTGAGHTLALLKTITMTKIKIGIISTIVVAAVVAPLVLQHQSRVKLREADEGLRRQAAQEAKLQAENDRLSDQVAEANKAIAQSNELQRLRAEAGSLRQHTNDLPNVQKDNRRLQAAVDRPDLEPTEEQQQEVMAKMSYGKSRFMASVMYARKNQGQFPSSFEQVASSFPDGAKGGTDPTDEPFEIVYQGSLKALGGLTNAPEVIVVRQKQPMPYGNRWAKVYGYGDGHFEIHSQAEKDFEAWENQRMLSPLASRR